MKRCLQNCLIKEDQANESALIADADRIFLPKSTLFQLARLRRRPTQFRQLYRLGY